MVEMSESGTTLAHMNRLAGVTLTLIALAIACVGVGCVPRERGSSVEIKRESDTSKIRAPKLPKANPTASQMEQAIVFDLRNRPDSQDFWTPTRSEAKCVAQEVVSGVGLDRLSSLGFQPGTQGASLVDIAMTADERAKVVAALTSCVDTHEAASSLFFGKGRISAKAAECVADVLDKAGMVPIFFEAWINAKPVDPFANDGNLANTMSAAAQVCLSPGELNWPTLRSAVDDQDLIDSDLPAGSRDSNHPDDRRLREEESN